MAIIVHLSRVEKLEKENKQLATELRRINVELRELKEAYRHRCKAYLSLVDRIKGLNDQTKKG
jgi:predicted patatin/cPLA2 family phospholipase